MHLTTRCHRTDRDAPSPTDIERRIRVALGRFSRRVGQVTVIMEDVNGPRGGQDKRCRAVIGLVPRGRFAVEATDASYETALRRMADRVRHAVARTLDRRRGRKGWLSASGQAT